MNTVGIKKENFGRAGFNNTVITFFSKMLGYFSFMLVAYIFGTRVSTDIFFLGTSFVVVTTGMFTILIVGVFPPILIRLRTTASLQEALDFASSVLTWLISITGIISIIFFLFPVEVFLIISKYNVVVLEENKRLLLYFAAILFATVVVEFMRIFIQSMGQFTTTALISLVQSVILITCIMTLSGSLQIESLAIGTLLSLTVQLFLMIGYSHRKNTSLRISFSFGPHLKELLRIGLPLWIAHWITMAAVYYGDYSASGLKGGVLTAVTFSQKIYILPVVIIFNPLLEIINTKFSEYYNTDKELLKQQFIAIVRILFFILVPISVFLIVFRNEIVHLLFVRGAFSENDAEITSTCLGIYSLMIVSTCYLQVGVRIIFTLQKTVWTSFFGTIGFFLTMLTMHFFVQWFGYWGLPASRVIVELLYFVPFTSIFLYIYLNKMSFKEILFSFCMYSFLSIITISGTGLLARMVFFGYFSKMLSVNMNYFLIIFTSGVTCLAFLYLIFTRMKNKDLKYLRSTIISRFHD